MDTATDPGLTICVTDDHSLFREGLVMLFSGKSGISSVLEAQNGLELLALLEQYPVDLILMDIEMPVMNGIDTTREALKRYPDMKVIALSMYGNENYYSEMIDAGARGFLLKNSRFEDVARAIDEVAAGNNYFSPEILEAIIRTLNRKQKRPDPGLTDRESEILYHICKGLSNQEIAETLFISKRTVDKHRENLLLKTQSKNTAGLVIYAIKNHVVEV